MESKISLIMPTYNRAGNFLKFAIESVLKQTYNGFELIIVDDASTDKTKEVVMSFGNPKIVYHQTDHNHGEYWSTNYGMSMSKGKYVTWIHSDDLLPINSLELRLKELEQNSGLDFVHGDIEKIDENGNVIEKIEAIETNSQEVFQKYIKNLDEGNMVYLIHHTTIMMRRSFFYKVGPFDSSLPFAGDIDWMVRALRIGNYKKIPSVLYLYRKHASTRRVVDIKQGVDKVTIHKNIAERYV